LIVNLARKNAIITGASGGIGRAIAMELAGRGVNVCLLSRNDVDVREYLETGASGGVCAWAYKGDLSSDTDLAGFCEFIRKQVPTVDVLVHSAGAYHAGMIAETQVDQLDRLYRVNLRAPYILTRSLLPRLKESKGQIVFMNSSAGVKGAEKLSHYSSSKFALRALADCLRLEVNGDGIRVLSIFPGRTASKMQDEIHRLEQRAYDPDSLIQPGDIAEIVVKSLQLPTSAEVTDIHIRPFRKPVV
jgi:NAD(P)-dependent dehydrogenase (short-subunit alcohol dehydrogenase family)